MEDETVTSNLKLLLVGLRMARKCNDMEKMALEEQQCSFEERAHLFERREAMYEECSNDIATVVLPTYILDTLDSETENDRDFGVLQNECVEALVGMVTDPQNEGNEELTVDFCHQALNEVKAVEDPVVRYFMLQKMFCGAPHVETVFDAANAMSQELMSQERFDILTQNGVSASSIIDDLGYMTQFAQAGVTAHIRYGKDVKDKFDGAIPLTGYKNLLNRTATLDSMYRHRAELSQQQHHDRLHEVREQALCFVDERKYNNPANQVKAAQPNDLTSRLLSRHVLQFSN